MRSRRPRSADRLRALLATSDGALKMYCGEALYHVQVDYTCQLLDVVDGVTDEVTAALITAALYENLTGNGITEAAKRTREARAEYERLMREPWPVRPHR